MDFIDDYYKDEDLSLLKKLTLVIPTYNRNYYLSRCLWYHAHFPFGEIIVADSSPEEVKVVNRNTVAKVREMFGANVKYLEYEPETEKYGGDFFRKWGDGVQHVETEYSQIVTDKEFLIPTTLISLIKIMDNSEDLCVSEGTLLVTRYDRFKQLYCDTWQSYGSAKSDNIYNRFLDVIKNNVCPLLGLYKTKYHKLIYRAYLEYSINDLRFGEAFLELDALVYGKYLRVPDDVHTVRDITSLFTNSKINPDLSATLRYTNIWDYPPHIFKEKYSQFYFALSNILALNNKVMPEEHTSKWLNSYLNNYLKSRFKNNIYINRTFVVRLWHQLPYQLQIIIKNIYKYINHIPISRTIISSELNLILLLIVDNKTVQFLCKSVRQE